MLRQTTFAVFAIAVILAFSGLSLAQYPDDDDGYYQGDRGQARQYGYQQGYRDGYDKGRHEGLENDPYDYQNPDWRQATRGYQQWMGPVEAFQNAYRDGYRNGFRAGYQSLNRGWGDGDGDRDEPIYNRGGYVYGQSGYGNGGNVGYRTGFQDGISQAREDTYKDKPFNANPRGKYDDRDHGYRRGYGDKNSYKAQYSDGYRAGYESAFRRY
jgi:hypothetical protein